MGCCIVYFFFPFVFNYIDGMQSTRVHCSARVSSCCGTSIQRSASSGNAAKSPFLANLQRCRHGGNTTICSAGTTQALSCHVQLSISVFLPQIPATSARENFVHQPCCLPLGFAKPRYEVPSPKASNAKWVMELYPWGTPAAPQL